MSTGRVIDISGRRVRVVEAQASFFAADRGQSGQDADISNQERRQAGWEAGAKKRGGGRDRGRGVFQRQQNNVKGKTGGWLGDEFWMTDDEVEEEEEEDGARGEKRKEMTIGGRAINQVKSTLQIKRKRG